MPKKKPLPAPEVADRRAVYDEVCSIYKWAARMGYRDLADRIDAVAVAVWSNYPAK